MYTVIWEIIECKKKVIYEYKKEKFVLFTLLRIKLTEVKNRLMEKNVEIYLNIFEK